MITLNDHFFIFKYYLNNTKKKKKSRGRLKITLVEVIKNDLLIKEITKNRTSNIIEWGKTIHVAYLNLSDEDPQQFEIFKAKITLVVVIVVKCFIITFLKILLLLLFNITNSLAIIFFRIKLLQIWLQKTCKLM